jgi:hypothetical protein
METKDYLQTYYQNYDYVGKIIYEDEYQVGVIDF